MKFIESHKSRKTGAEFVFQITAREKDLLFATLRFYPQLDTGHHALSRDPKTVRSSDQQWLEEAMAQQRAEQKKKLDQFLIDNDVFFKRDKASIRFTLSGEQMEWLLRVLNDIRVGSWVQLGQPEMEEARKKHVSGPKAHLFAAMELSGYFQNDLLAAFS